MLAPLVPETRGSVGAPLRKITMQNSPTSQRQHFWDTLRAFLMLLGIPYHVALCYQVGQDFIVHSGEAVPGFLEFSQTTHLFRMHAFFVVAEYFALLLLARREPGAWLKGRFVRLGFPLVTTMVTLVPLMNLFCEWSNMPLHEAVPNWQHNAVRSGGYWVRHLWFLMALLYFSVAVAWLASRFPAVKSGMVPDRIDAWGARHFFWVVMALGTVIGIWEALALEAFYMAGLNTNFPQQILRIDDIIIYAPWFALGCVLARTRAMLERTCRISIPVAIVGVGAIVLWLTIHSDVSPMTERFIAAFAAIGMTQVMIALARSLLDRPVPLVRRLTDSSFVVYLFHLPWIALLVLVLQPVPIPPAFKALAVTVLSFLFSYWAWQGIRRVPILSLLYDGVVIPSKRRAPA